MKIVLFVLLTVVLVILLSAGHDTLKNVLRVSDGERVSFELMIREVKKANIIFVGEVHNQREHHRAELNIIKAFHESDTLLVVGLEMFRAESDKALDGWIEGTLPLDKFLPLYYNNWREPWPYYREIFVYMREHRIPAIGLNIPDDVADAVAKNGFESLSKEQRKRLPSVISCDIDPTYMDFVKKAYAAHGWGGDRQFLNFCEAQMIWDKTMAWNLVQFLNRNPGKTVIVLCGVGHAWKRGIPEQVGGFSKYTYKVIMPIIPDQIDPGSVTTRDADYVLLR